MRLGNENQARYTHPDQLRIQTPENPTMESKGTLPSQFWTWKRALGEEYRIRYQRHGGDSGPVVICVHGFGGNCVSVPRALCCDGHAYDHYLFCNQRALPNIPSTLTGPLAQESAGAGPKVPRLLDRPPRVRLQRQAGPPRAGEEQALLLRDVGAPDRRW